METRLSFLFYLSWEQQVDLMTDNELRRFIKNLCRNTKGEEVDLPSREEKLCWMGIAPALETNKLKYDKRVERNRENGKLGGAPRGNQNARKDETAQNKSVGTSQDQKTTQNNPNNPIRDNRKKIIDNRQEETDNSKLARDKRQEKIDKSEMLNINWQLLNQNCKDEVNFICANNTKERSESVSTGNMENVQPQYNYKRDYKYLTSYTGSKLTLREFKQLNEEQQGEYRKFVLDLDVSEIGPNERSII